MKLAIVLAILLRIQSAIPQCDCDKCDCSKCECIECDCIECDCSNCTEHDCSNCTEHDCTECGCFQTRCNECDCKNCTTCIVMTCSEPASANKTSTSTKKPTKTDTSSTSATMPTKGDEFDTSSPPELKTFPMMTTASRFHLKPTSASNVTTITIAAIASIAIIIIAVLILLTLACYWKYRLKTIRERNQAKTEKNNAKIPSTNLQDMSNPVYSVIADDQATVPPLPPTLPPNGTPYYQEIESDQLGADYETPIKSIPSTQHEEATKEELSEMLKH